MKKFLVIALTFSVLLIGCKKSSSPVPEIKESILADNTMIVSKDINTSALISVDSTKLTFATTGTGTDKIKVGSIVVSDISSIAPVGFLRKVISISNSGGNVICQTEQASLTDAIENGSVKFTKTFTDNDIISEDSSGVDISAKTKALAVLSFNFSYSKPIYDEDKNLQTKNDQILISGDIKIEPTFDFELDIKKSSVNKFMAKISIKNTNNIKAEAKSTFASIKEEIVLKSFQLKPFTILVVGVPVPIANQWIAIVLGVDGKLSAKITAGAQNINTANAGIVYENSSWNSINIQENTLSLLPLTFEGVAKIEPWLQVRYEIRPYGIKESRIYIGVKGSAIAEATLIPTGLNTTLKWGIKFSALAQMQIFDRAVLNYEKIFYEQEFPFYQANSFAYPSLTTTTVTNIMANTASSGGNITSDGGAPVTARGICWSTSQSPTPADYKTLNGSGSGIFTSTLTGLTASTTYYVRAFATNSAGTAYGNQVTFTTGQTIAMPTVTTNSITSITQTTASSGGNVTSDGGAAVTARGVCWSTSQTPTTANNKTTDGSGTGSFTSNITGLTANTTYYVRAWATNSVNTAYGNQVTFTTGQTISMPTVTTNSITSITQTTASSGGNVTSDGGATVTARGVCWSTTQTPTTSNFKTTDGSGINTFTSNLTGLTANTTYYVRAYATNSVNTAYGNQVTFTTTSSDGTGTVTDIDGNVYNTVTIGTQVWMVENLKTTKYRNGESIPNVTVGATWAALTTGAYCWYNNDAATNKAIYGGLYNWYAATDSRNIAPLGWHVPTYADWTALVNYLGGVAIAGGKLKESGTAHWNSPNTGATNESGFSGLSGGFRPDDGIFYYSGMISYWWSTAADPQIDWPFGLQNNWNNVLNINMTKTSGLYVRCIKN